MEKRVSATTKASGSTVPSAAARRMPPPFLQRRAKQPPRTEIGRVYWAQTERKAIGKPARYHFWLQGLGPKGYYAAGRSAEFEYPTKLTAMPDTGVARKAFNEFVAKLWEDGWTPAAFPGPRSGWYEITMRRIVATSGSHLGAPAEDSADAATRKADWYPDPAGRFEQRYWDGTAWTEHVTSRGVTAVDPYQESEADG